MPNEIYHRSNFGNPNAEGFGDVYYDHAATNKLYNHSDYYENSDGTDATLKDLNNKASIVLTPTAYSDGSLNTVIPPYQVLPTELVTNGDFSNGTSNWTAVSAVISASNNILTVDDSANAGGDSRAVQSFTTKVGVTYKVRFNRISTTSSFYLGIGGGVGYNNIFYANLGTDLGIYERTFIATDTTSTIALITSGTGITKFSEVSIKEIQEADFDFSRGSSATRVNEQGLVEDVQILSGELVQNGNFEQIGAEEVTNGNFDTDSDWIKQTGWSISDGKAIATSTNGSLYQANDFVSGKIYRIRFQITSYESGGLICRFNNDETNIFNSVGTHTLYFKSDNSFDFVYFLGNSFTGSIDNVSVKEVGQNWTLNTGWSIGDGVAIGNASIGTGSINQQGVFEIGKKYQLKLDATLTSGSFKLEGSGGSTLATFNETKSYDVTIEATQVDLMFRRITSSFIGSIDNISVVEITDDTDLPRIDFTDGTGSLLLEPQRTNFLTYSEDFSQWSTAGTITVESGYLAPDGSTNAYKITDGAPSNNATALFLVGVAAADNARTIYAKTVSGTGTANLCSHNSNTNNLFTVTNEWQRFEVNSATGTGVTNFYGVDFRNSGTLTEILIWGAQTEVGDYATSYIPTSGSTVTRSADVANNSGNADLFNDSEGVLYWEAAALNDDVGSTRTLSISDGSGTNTLYTGYNSSSNVVQAQLVVGGVAQTNMLHTVSNRTDFLKVAILYQNNNHKMYINGVEVSVDTSGSVPSANTFNRLNFDLGQGSFDFYGKVKALAVFKEALSNDLLERLTGEGFESFRLLAEANNYTII